MPAKKTTVAVVGDVTVNWMLSLPDSVDGPAIELAWAWGTGHVAGLSASVGGAAELDRLALAATADVRPPVKVVGPRIPAKALTQPGDRTFAHSHTAWAPFRRSADQPSEQAWRIASYLGDEPPARGSAPAAVAGADDADVLAIVDMHLGFGDDPRCWPAGLQDGAGPREVLLIESSPLARGPFGSGSSSGTPTSSPCSSSSRSCARTHCPWAIRSRGSRSIATWSTPCAGRSSPRPGE